VPEDHLLFQEIKKTRSPLLIDDVQRDNRFEDFGANYQIRGWMGVPLIDQGKVFGYYSFDSNTPGKFTAEMAQLAQVMVNQTASAITKAKLFEDTQLGFKRLEALHEIDRIITSSVELNFAIRQIMQIVVGQLEIDAGSVVLYDPYALTFTPINTIGFRSQDYKQHYLYGNGYASKVALMRKTLRIDDQEEINNLYKSSEGILNEGFTSYVGVPLIARSEIKGVLELFHRTPLETTPEWDDFLQTLATQLAIAIDNTQMFENLQKSNLELTLSYDATIEGWAKTLELRDQETQGHSERVTIMTVELARAMGLSEEELVHVRRGALLHDVGKIGIPDSILQKPDALNDEERAMMENHPALAFNVLSGSVFLEKALDIPYCHHEKWDGTGYPRQLKGEKIPLAARVFAIIDVYDALRSDRPYRDAWPKSKTIKYIKDQSGIHFDPQVVDTFLSLVDQDPDFNVYPGQ
jgi:HD-GYP domain-containing protein (c-di-GMP phosphodiesterase class II)